MSILAIPFRPTAVRFNNSQHTVEALITRTQPYDPLRDHYITVCRAPLKKTKRKLPSSHPFGLSITSTIIKLFVCVLVGGKLCNSLWTSCKRCALLCLLNALLEVWHSASRAALNTADGILKSWGCFMLGPHGWGRDDRIAEEANNKCGHTHTHTHTESPLKCMRAPWCQCCHTAWLMQPASHCFSSPSPRELN